jgi:hypothetical protein
MSDWREQSSVFKNRVRHILPILLVDLSATIDKKDVDIVSSEAPNSKCTAEGSNAPLELCISWRGLLSPGDMPRPRGQDNLRGVGSNLTARLLSLDSTEETQKVQVKIWSQTERVNEPVSERVDN